MTSDEDRIGFLAGDHPEGLDDADGQDLDELRDLLADPSVWVEPHLTLEDAVVAAVAAEARTAAPPTGTSAPRLDQSRRLLPRLAVAAIAAAALVVAVVLVADRDDGSGQLAASLEATDQAAEATGYATFTETDSGWRIEFDADGLPRLDDGRFYQAWLRNDAGDLVSIGTFNEPEDVVLWAGVSPRDFPVITVTEQTVGEEPGSPTRRVLAGPITEP